jgi:chromosome segregation ATPase
MAGVSNTQLLEALRALDARLAELDKRIALSAALVESLAEDERASQARSDQHERELRSLQAALQELRLSNRILTWFAALTGGMLIVFLGERALTALL